MRVPVTAAGRVDALLMWWRLTLVEAGDDGPAIECVPSNIVAVHFGRLRACRTGPAAPIGTAVPVIA